MQGDGRRRTRLYRCRHHKPFSIRLFLDEQNRSRVTPGGLSRGVRTRFLSLLHDAFQALIADEVKAAGVALAELVDDGADL